MKKYQIPTYGTMYSNAKALKDPDNSEFLGSNIKMFGLPDKGVHALVAIPDTILIITGDDGIYKASKELLENNSGYFNSLFRSGMKEREAGFVRLESVESCHLEVILKYLDNPKKRAGISMDNIQSLTETAFYLQADTFLECCCKFIKKNLTNDTVFFVNQLSVKYGLVNLHKDVVDYLSSNFESLLDYKKESLLTLDLDTFCEVLDSDELNVSSEYTVLLAAQRYVREQLRSLSWSDNNLPTILEKVRFISYIVNIPDDPEECYVLQKHFFGSSAYRKFYEICQEIKLNEKFRPTLQSKASLIRQPRALVISLGGYLENKGQRDVRILFWQKIQQTPRFRGRYKYYWEKKVDDTSFVSKHAMSGHQKQNIAATFNSVIDDQPETKTGVSEQSHKQNKNLLRISSLTTNHEQKPTVLILKRAKGWSLPHPQCDHAACVFNNYLYVAGGQKNQRDDGKYVTRNVYRFDPLFMSWVQVASMNTARCQFYLGLQGKSLYAVGGFDGTNYNDDERELRSVERYDLHTDKWAFTKDLPIRLHEHAGCNHNGVMYISGGYSSDLTRPQLHSNRCFYYSDSAETWLETARMTYKRCDHAMQSDGKRIFVLGGCVFTSFHDTYATVAFVDVPEYYDPVANTWTSIRMLPKPAAGMSSLIVGHKLLCIGGHTWDHNSIRQENNRYKKSLFVRILDMNTLKWNTRRLLNTGVTSNICVKLQISEKNMELL